MTELYLIRHGETEWNRSGHHQGHMDSALTQTGIEQAEAKGERLKDEGHNFSAIYTSDLYRARHTAELITAQLEQKDIIQDALPLRERSLGVLEGLTYPEIKQQLPEDYDLHTAGDPHYRPEGGESWADTFSRACPFLREICRKHTGQKIMAVSHGGVLGMALRDALGLTLLPPRRFSLPNVGLNIFEYSDNDWTLRTWGDTSHMNGVTALDEVMK